MPDAQWWKIRWADDGEVLELQGNKEAVLNAMDVLFGDTYAYDITVISPAGVEHTLYRAVQDSEEE